ncbi:ABC transporter permease [Pedobacter sp. KR3-3]|uniref:ABC transporter permease n=1 Tax=Pedobacter albus TaxID=3113905 RepID=A0ABU7I5R8_9SPHI|nr:ABC transporter permease [Pedobacter sp. KR3-3]MEE1944815.1 ABC transporter permease [Pedobacter sp. KR3-3]
MFQLNLKIALRNLWKNKGYTLINVGGLAIGLASCMLLLIYVAYEWSFDRQAPNSDKTYVVYNNFKTDAETFSWAWTPGVMAKEVQETIPGVAYASHSSYPQQQLIGYDKKQFKKNTVCADQAFLKILDLKFSRGNAEQALNDVNSVVLTETLAKSLFGNEDPINKTLKLNNNDVLKVSGVIADIPYNSSIRFDYLLTWDMYLKQNPWAKNNNWGSNHCLTLVQLQDNALFNKANAEMKGIYGRHVRDANVSTALLHPLTKWHLYDKFENGKSVGGRIDQIKLFFILAFCILLIACVNFMNLSTARSEKRSKEVGVRKAIGSSRKSLINQFMLESLLLAVIGMAVAFVLIEVSLPYFNGLLNIHLAIDYTDWKFWSALISLTIITGLLAGSYPAFYLSSFEPIKVLKGFSLPGKASISVRKVLVVFQFTFAACLIVCTAVVYQQLNFIKNKPIGFQKAGLIEIPIQGNLLDKSKFNLLKQQLLASGAATHVSAFSTGLNEGGNNTFGISWPGKNPKENVLFNTRAVDFDLIKTIGSQLVSGREFSSNADFKNKQVMLNEAAVKVMKLKEGVGATLTYGNDQVTVIGVMKDFTNESPYQSVRPMIMYYYPDDLNRVLIRLNPNQNISASVNQVDEVVKSINPDFPVDRVFVDDNFEQKFNNEKLLGTLSNWFGGFAIFISCLGLLGLALFMAEQRKKEISIRKVLGANTTDILTLLNKDFVKLVAIANLIAFPLAYIIVSKWLSAFEFRVGISVWPFVIAMVACLVIAILTVSIQSIKVAKSNPIDALKYE